MPFLTDTPADAILTLPVLPRASRNAIVGPRGQAPKNHP